MKEGGREGGRAEGGEEGLLNLLSVHVDCATVAQPFDVSPFNVCEDERDCLEEIVVSTHTVTDKVMRGVDRR